MRSIRDCAVCVVGGAGFIGSHVVSGAPDGQDAAAVWADYAAVWHLEENGGPYLDATANDHDGTGDNAPTRASGMFNFGQEFHATSGEGIRLAAGGLNDDFDGAEGIACTAWIRCDQAMSQDDVWTIVSEMIATGTPGLRFYLTFDAASGQMAAAARSVAGEDEQSATTSGGVISTDTWYHVAARVDFASGTITLLRDGVVQATGEVAFNSSSYTASGEPVDYDYLGRSASGEYFDGVVDEVRLCPAALSDAWVKFEYYNITQSGNDLIWGSHELATAAPAAELITDYEVDSLGRTTQVLGPLHEVDGVEVRTAAWTVYKDAAREVRSARGYATPIAEESSSSSDEEYTYTLVNPVSITKMDASGRTIETIQATRASTEGRLSADDTFAQTSYVRWNTQQYSGGQLKSTRAYHEIPSSTGGDSGANYNETEFGYDAQGRQNRVRTPGGTITRTVFDRFGQQTEVWVGTDDSGATDDDPTGMDDSSSSSGEGINNMVVVTEYAYGAGGCAGCGGSNGLLTQVVQHVAEGVSRQSDYVYDWRNRQVYAVQPSDSANNSVYSMNHYDNLDRVVKAERYYDADADGPGSSADAPDQNDTLLARSETFYDDRGRVYPGELTGLISRVSYVAHWYDEIGRSTATANYGALASPPTRPDSAPDSSDTVLVTRVYYNDDGEAYRTIDAAEKERRTTFDDAGRTTKTVESYTDGNPGTGTADQDVTVETTYTPDGQVETLTAVNSVTGDQVTTYYYATTLQDSEIARADLLRAVVYPDSDDSGTPPSSGADGVYDRVEYRYNRQGERIEMTDQNETIHTYSYDHLGRLIADAVEVAGGSDIDQTVLRMERTYEVRGMIETVTSYDAAEGGNALNEVKCTYNDLGMVEKFYQEHDAVDGSTPYVQYTYDETASGGQFTKGMRLKEIGYPSTRRIEYGYGSVLNDAMNRPEEVRNLWEGEYAGQFVYSYLGASLKWDVTRMDPEVWLSVGLDRFDRVTDHHWQSDNPATIARLLHGYDRAGNRLWREDAAAAAASVNMDELYIYDGVNRLTQLQRGELTTSPSPSISSRNFAEYWWLDATGNWDGYARDQNGDGTIVPGDDMQSRYHNKANEITDITKYQGMIGYPWAGPMHDRAGNMTEMPQPSAVNSLYAATYDAWNRLVRIDELGLEDSSSSGTPPTVAEYAYDGRNFRITRTAYADGEPDETRHFYYNNEWQCLEECLESGGEIAEIPDVQYIWGLRYIDDLILRERDFSLDEHDDLVAGERVYAVQDANWNVVALMRPVGEFESEVLERYRYDAYGTPTVLNPNFTVRAGGTQYAWQHLFTARRRDPATALMHYRNRHYHPQLGRFVTRDPIGYDAGVNLYCYVGDDPVSCLDPAGTDRVVIAMEGFGEKTGISGTFVDYKSPVGQVVRDLVKEKNWHHFGWTLSESRKEIFELIKKKMPGRSPDCYDTIILIGFSFGGDAVHDLAHLLKAEGISVNLVVTLDPVPRLPKIKDKDPGYSKSDNVERWVNFFQRHSKVYPVAGIKGWGVKGADIDTELTKSSANPGTRVVLLGKNGQDDVIGITELKEGKHTAPHVSVPIHADVLTEIRKSVIGVADWRESYEYKGTKGK